MTPLFIAITFETTFPLILLGGCCVFLFMVFWNWTLPGVFGLPSITFWQALRLLLMIAFLGCVFCWVPLHLK